MADIERHEEEGAKAFDPHLARRLLRYLKPYRLRATTSVVLVILSSFTEVAAGLYFATLGANFVILYTQMVMMNLMGQYIMYDLRKEIFGHLQKLDIQYFDRHPVGRLMTRVTTDVDALNEMFTAGFVSIFGDIVVLAGIIGVLFWMNWKMALVLFSITPFIIGVSAWFRRGARLTYRAVRVR